MSDVILAMSIGVNIPKWKGRVEAAREDYDNGHLGGIEVYFPPVGAFNYNPDDIRSLRKRLDKEITDSKRPLYVGGHLAHGAHGFNLLDGLTDVNEKCIDSAVNNVKIMGARHLVVHAGGLYPGQRADMDNVRRVLDYLVDKLKDTECTVVLENMYKKPNDPREPFFCNPNEDDIVQRIALERGIKKCFDWTHWALHLEHVLRAKGYQREEFVEKYYGGVIDFLEQEPRVFHISSFKPGDKKDMYGFFSEFNRRQLRAIALSKGFLNNESVPTVIEVKYVKWEGRVDRRNLEISSEELSNYRSLSLSKKDAKIQIQKEFNSWLNRSD